jgi:antitoxin component of MazEF toxin-antitoxin module
MRIYGASKKGSRVIIAFRKWANSLAVRIPKALAAAIEASDGKRVERQ